MTENKPYIPWDTIGPFLRDAFIAYGVPADDAEICVDVLLESDRRGIGNHGCERFKLVYIDRIKNGTLLPVTELEVLKETQTTLVMDAHDGMGMVASYRMMERLIAKAKEFGMAGGAIRNSTHYGIAGYWTGMASDVGLIGISGTNARPSTAPTFGVENMLGTNPLTFSMPTDEAFPFCLDCGTAIAQRSQIECNVREGVSTPADVVITEDGKTITDSALILEKLKDGTASFAPIGGVGNAHAGYKGYGYATVVEILSAALAGGQFMKALSGMGPDGSPQMYHLGHFFFVVDPEAYMGLDTFRKIAGDICRQLRASKKMPGYDRIYTAGEKEYEAWLDRKDKGVPVSRSLQQDLIAVRDEKNLPYHFDFEDNR